MGNHAKLNYIHIFRAIAIIIIVAGHCIYSKQEILNQFFSTFLKGGTALFVFIAGFLFQYLSDTFTYPTYLKKKFFNVVLPYILTSIIGITWILLSSNGNPFASVNKAVQVGMLLTTGFVHNLPTWYIPMTCVLFLCAPILLKLEKTLVFRKYSLLFLMLPVLICLTCFVPRFERIFFANEKIMTAWQIYGGYLKKILFDTVLMFPVYIFGMFFASNKEKYINFIYKKRGLLWIVFIIGVCGHFFLDYYKFLPSRLLFNNVILILLILAYLWHYDEKIKAHPYINKALGTVADYSFAIFFFHFYFVKGVSKIFNHFFHWHTMYLSAENFHLSCYIIYSGIKFVIAFFGSLFIAMLIKKILEKLGIKHTRYFIGA